MQGRMTKFRARGSKWNWQIRDKRSLQIPSGSINKIFVWQNRHLRRSTAILLGVMFVSEAFAFKIRPIYPSLGGLRDTENVRIFAWTPKSVGDLTPAALISMCVCHHSSWLRHHDCLCLSFSTVNFDKNLFNSAPVAPAMNDNVFWLATLLFAKVLILIIA